MADKWITTKNVNHVLIKAGQMFGWDTKQPVLVIKKK